MLRGHVLRTIPSGQLAHDRQPAANSSPDLPCVQPAQVWDVLQGRPQLQLGGAAEDGGAAAAAAQAQAQAQAPPPPGAAAAKLTHGGGGGVASGGFVVVQPLGGAGRGGGEEGVVEVRSRRGVADSRVVTLVVPHDLSWEGVDGGLAAGRLCFDVVGITRACVPDVVLGCVSLEARPHWLQLMNE